jgi:hypothetical protein
MLKVLVLGLWNGVWGSAKEHTFQVQGQVSVQLGPQLQTQDAKPCCEALARWVRL